LPQHDRRMPLPVDMARRQERRIQHVHGDAVLVRHLGQLLQLLDRRVEPTIRDLRRRDDVLDPESPQRPESLLRIARLPSAAPAAPASALGRRGAFNRRGPATPFASSAAALLPAAASGGRSQFHERPLWRGRRGGNGIGRGNSARKHSGRNELASIHGRLLRASTRYRTATLATAPLQYLTPHSITPPPRATPLRENMRRTL